LLALRRLCIFAAFSGCVRVCSGSTDPEGNTCVWINCGYLTATPNQYFGGCINNPTAGALCCL